jgi:predicted dehydrogenase
VGVVGLGPWGARLARTLADSPQADLRWLCDQRPVPTVRAQLRPEPIFTLELDDLLSDETLDAVALATPPATRYALVQRALEADKHVYVEGPVAARAEEAEELMRLAARRNRRLMAGHVLLFHPGVRKLKEQMELGRLGEVYYVTAELATPHRCGGDGNVLSSVAGDAVATILYLLGDEPVSAHAVAESYVDPKALEVAVCYLRFATGIAAMLQLSWLDAREHCRLAVVGSRKTGVFDADEPGRKLTIYEKGSPRGAEIVSPRVALEEPLRLQCESFLTGVRSAVEFPSTRIAPAVVRVLELLDAESHGLSSAVNGKAAPASHLRLAFGQALKEKGPASRPNRGRPLQHPQRGAGHGG